MMKRILKGLALSALLTTSVLAGSGEGASLGSAEIVENGKIVHKFDPLKNMISDYWTYVDLLVVYDGRYFRCRLDTYEIRCTERPSISVAPLPED